jgi:hypothetical protein
MSNGPAEHGGRYGQIISKTIPVEDLFPDGISGDEVDRRINHMGTKIKLWVISGVAANLLFAIPTIFFMGQMSQSVREMATSVNQLQQDGRDKAKVDDAWVRDRIVWEAQVEAALKEKGIRVK